MRKRALQQDRNSILHEFGCFGHYHPGHCAQVGFIGACPMQRLCRQQTFKTDTTIRENYDISRETLDKMRARRKDD